MREVDKRTQFSRRGLLRAGATAVPAAALVGASISPTAAWAEAAANLTPHAMATLVRMARDIYPHDHIADVFYIKAVTPWDAKAGKDPAARDMVMTGIARLDSDAQDHHRSDYLGIGWEADRVALLRGIEATKFFSAVRADLVVALYNQPEIWPKFGYEGSSAEHGGYLHRGFNDIDWLPSA
ncbi:MAG: gluconate 2-dehydrogenase subunit 3 family protein [Acetobacteraceae bacterium]|nr:gluconate 2-dehydrogenase subunit 3 family protein [Acetobacteraceae bacterium]